MQRNFFGLWLRSLVLSLVLALGLLGCGGDSPESTVISDREPAPPRTPASPEPVLSSIPGILDISFEPSPPRSGRTLNVVVELVPEDRGRFAISYRWTVAGRRRSETGDTIKIGEVGRGSRIRVDVELRGHGGELTERFVESRVENSPPRVEDLRLIRNEGDAGAEWVAETRVDDQDGDEVKLSYTWFVNDRRRSQSTDHYLDKELSRGDRLRVRVVASDGDDKSQAVESQVVEIKNRAPKIVSSPPPLNGEGSFLYRLEATDPDGDRSLRFQLGDAPAGMSLDSLTGQISWQPSEDQAGEHKVSVAVNDRHGGRGEHTFYLAIVLEDASTPLPAALP